VFDRTGSNANAPWRRKGLVSMEGAMERAFEREWGESYKGGVETRATTGVLEGKDENARVAR